MAGALAVRRHTNQQDQDAAAGWFVLDADADADELVWKDDAMEGYASYAGYSTHTHVAIILLSNTWSRLSTPLLGRHLLNPAFMAPALREPIDTDPARLAAYTGRYSSSLQLVITVPPREGCLMMQAAGQMETETFLVSDTNFVVRDSRAVVAFELDWTAPRRLCCCTATDNPAAPSASREDRSDCPTALVCIYDNVLCHIRPRWD